MWVIIKKLIKDLLQDRLKLTMLLLAALMAIVGISTVMYGHWFTERDFEANFESANTADMVLSSRQLDEISLKDILSRDEIESVEKRGLISARIKDDDGDWLPLLLHIVEDFNKVEINRFSPKFTSPPSNGTILIEQNGRTFLLDDSNVNVQIPTYGIFDMSIHGYVHDARLPPSQMEHMLYGYIALNDIKLLVPDYKSERLLIKTTNRYSREELEELGENIKNEFSEKASLSILVPEPNVHPHQNIVDALSLLQKWFGSIVAFLGIILFSLVFLGWILPQIKEIGMMKALGASERNIKWAYLITIILLSVCCLIPGLIFGYIGGYLYNRFIAFTQNFEVVEEAFPLTNHLLVIGCSMILPILVSYGPIVRACRSNTRETISQIFSPAHKVLLRFSQQFFAKTETRYTINNILRHSIRFSLNVCLLTIGLSLLFMGMHLKHSLKTDTNQFFETSAFQFSVYYSEEQKALPVSNIADSQNQYPIYKKTVFPNHASLHQPFLLKYVPHDFAFPPSHILKGRLQKGCDNCLWINQGLSPEFKEIEVGDSLSFQDGEGNSLMYIYKGIIKEFGVGGTMYTYRSAELGNTFTELWLSFQNLSSEETGNKKDELEHYYEQNGIAISFISNNQRRLQMIRDHLKPTFITIQVMGILGIICGLFGLGAMINIQLSERKGEIGLLRALGTSQRKIAQIWLNEVLILNILAISLGLLCSFYGAVKLCEIFGDTILHTPILFFPDWLTVLLLSIGIVAGQLILGGPYLINLFRKAAYERLNQGVD